VFGFTLFYSYIFIRKNRLGRKADYKVIVAAAGVFRKGKKLSAPSNSIKEGDISRPFFMSCRGCLLPLEWALLNLLLIPVVKL
jgi:hypothetical protein